MNLLSLADDLKNLSDQQLAQKIQQPDGTVPQFLLIAEGSRRKDVRARAQQPSTQNFTPVSEELPQQLMGIQQLAAQQQALPGMAPQAQAVQLQQQPPQMDQSNQGQQQLNFAQGGLVSFAGGGWLDSDRGENLRFPRGSYGAWLAQQQAQPYMIPIGPGKAPQRQPLAGGEPRSAAMRELDEINRVASIPTSVERGTDIDRWEPLYQPSAASTPPSAATAGSSRGLQVPGVNVPAATPFNSGVEDSIARLQSSPGEMSLRARMNELPGQFTFSDDQLWTRRDADKERAGMTEPALLKTEEALRRMQEEQGGKRNENVGMALAMAGAQMMGSKSPFFGVGIGEGMAAGLNEFRVGEKDRRQQDLLLTQLESTVEQARRAEARGDMDAVAGYRDKYAEIRAKLLSEGFKTEAGLLDSKTQGIARLLGEDMQSRARLAGVEREGQYGLAKTDLAGKYALAGDRIQADGMRDYRTALMEESNRTRLLSEAARHYSRLSDDIRAELEKTPQWLGMNDAQRSAMIESRIAQRMPASMRQMLEGIGGVTPRRRMGADALGFSN